MCITKNHNTYVFIINVIFIQITVNESNLRFGKSQKRTRILTQNSHMHLNVIKSINRYKTTIDPEYQLNNSIHMSSVKPKNSR